MLSTQESRPRRKRFGRRRSSPADFTGSLTDAVPSGHAGPLHAGFPPVNRAQACTFPAAGRLRDAPVDRGFPQDQSDDPVMGLAGDLLQLREDPGPDPLAAAPADGGGTAKSSRLSTHTSSRTASTLDQLFENDRSAILRRRAAQRMGRVIDRPVGKKRGDWPPRGSSSHDAMAGTGDSRDYEA